MDPLLIIAVISGVALVLLVFAARLALRWIVRVILVGVLLLAIVGGGAWWWLNQSSPQSETKPRQTSNRNSNSNRR
jgi:energy-coupling factor transporter transmembrane protein EcfT